MSRNFLQANDQTLSSTKIQTRLLDKQMKLNNQIPISLNGSEVKLGCRNEWQSGLPHLGINDKSVWITYELKICYDKI
jgi:hypothetical protein